MVCTQTLENTSSKVTIDSKSTIKFSDGYATEFITNQVLTFKDNETAKDYYDNFNNDEGYSIKIDGSKVTFDYSKIIEKENIKTEDNTEDYIKKYLEGKNYKCELQK